MELLDDVIGHILGMLDASSLARAREVSICMGNYASEDNLWFAHCRRRWAHKQRHRLTPQREKALRATPSPWHQKYAHAELDAKRTQITREELCAISWSFSDNLQHPKFMHDGVLLMELYPPLSWK